MAAQTGLNSMVNLLCQRGASVQLRFASMNSLDEAVVSGDAKVVKTLIKHGADVNVTAAGDLLLLMMPSCSTRLSLSAATG
jgi:ankyrin repeat protein